MTKDTLERLRQDYFKQHEIDLKPFADRQFGLTMDDSNITTCVSEEAAYLKAHYYNARTQFHKEGVFPYEDGFFPYYVIKFTKDGIKKIREESPFFFVKTFEDCSIFAFEPHKEIRARQHLFLSGWTITDYQYDEELKIIRITAVR